MIFCFVLFCFSPFEYDEFYFFLCFCFPPLNYDNFGPFFSFKKNPFLQPFFSMVTRKKKKKKTVGPVPSSRLRGRLCKYKEKKLG
jgi:hypothetical protein